MPTAAVRVLRLLAPAKINLHLRVGPRRADGFHPLVTWMCTVGLFDKLRIEARLSADGWEAERAATQHGPEEGGRGAPPAAGAAGVISLVCDHPGLPCDRGNLVVRIAEAFGLAPGDGVGDGQGLGAGSRAETEFGRSGDVGGVRVVLGKNIPIGAGLGGGSSDAARTLLSLERLIGTGRFIGAGRSIGAGRAANDLSAFAAQFGSDVPFFLNGPSAICRGRGERVMPTPPPVARWAVLVLPDFSISTAAVYARFDKMNIARPDALASEPDWEAWAGMSTTALLPQLVNDLEPAAFSIAPELAKLCTQAKHLLARPVLMSGSGSSLFTLFDEEDHALAGAEVIHQECGVQAAAVEVAPNFLDDLNSIEEKR